MHKRERSPTPPSYNKRSRMSPPPRSRPDYRPQRTNSGHGGSSASGSSNPAEDRAARLAAMTSNATSLTAERKERLTTLLAEEKAELEAEEKARAKSGGMGSFLSQEQKKVFGGSGGLEDRIRRGRGGMVAIVD